MKKISYILLLVFATAVSFAQQSQNFSMERAIKTPPNPPRLVNDYANILTADQREALEAKLYQFDDSTTNQVTVVIVPHLDGQDVADAAIELGRNWGVGGKDNNNGVVLLISVEDRKLNISPGYGLEKALPDITCQQIIKNIIVPNFKGSDYYRGIDEGTNAIIQATKGEFKAPENYNQGGNGVPSGIIKIIFFIIIIVIVLALRSGGGRGGGSLMSRSGAMPFILGNLLGNMSRGGGGGFSGGGGGGSSGGFGGFGGGSFGGGGSSGSW
ncbi:MAG: TPM domain-containing protein [Ferruginibacter sp.]